MDTEQTIEAQRRYAAGLLHGVLATATRSGNLLHVEAHHEGSEPTGDLVIRVPVQNGAYRVRLERIEEERF